MMGGPGYRGYLYLCMSFTWPLSSVVTGASWAKDLYYLTLNSKICWRLFTSWVSYVGFVNVVHSGYNSSCLCITCCTINISISSIGLTLQVYKSIYQKKRITWTLEARYRAKIPLNRLPVILVDDGSSCQ